MRSAYDGILAGTDDPMILFFERKADKEGKLRLEVMVEEFEVTAGKHYLVTQLCHRQEHRTLSKFVATNRELGIRDAIAWYDEQLALLWPEASS